MPDRTEVYPNLYVGGGDCEDGFDGFVIDVRPEFYHDQLRTDGVFQIPVFQKLSGGGWRADPFVVGYTVESIAAHLDRGEKVLVRCGSGVERSPALVVLYLVRKKGLAPSEAYRIVREKRPQVVEELDILPLSYEERTR